MTHITAPLDLKPNVIHLTHGGLPHPRISVELITLLSLARSLKRI